MTLPQTEPVADMTKSTSDPNVANNDVKRGYAPVNGLHMYYEIHGTGKPLVLLHMGGPPNSQLAMLPGTTHFSILACTDLLLPIITPFLDAPMPAGI